MTGRTDYVSTFDFLNFLCEPKCGMCNNYTPCSSFMIQFKYMDFVHTMSYSEGE